ncbi:MAG TPA: nuclear transport factor 2 family protein [Methylophilaceae bacterium]|nr:nuclear transport factor 2 family protein [Methylophilaceae bacterium]
MKTATDMAEYEKIVATIQHYIDGAVAGKGELMKPAFHEGATIYGYVGDSLFSGPIQNLYDWNDINGPASDLQGRIVAIDIVGTVASVRLESANWTGYRFTDFFNLLKVDDQWKIMNKVFHLHAD